MNQRGSYYEVSCVSYSKDGLVIATGSLEGTLKLWDTRSYFCFSSTSEHEAKITAVKFSPKNSNTILTASLDGTVRAFDAKRYKYFRAMKPDLPNQFLCLEVDPTGDVDWLLLDRYRRRPGSLQRLLLESEDRQPD
jgi:periodic tryptophan protein 2